MTAVEERSLGALGRRGLLWVSRGIPLGVAIDPADGGAPRTVVRLGDRQVELTVEVAALHLESFIPRSDQELLDAARSLKLPDPAGALEELRREKLIAQLSDVEMDAVIEGSRLVSIAVGVGNSTDAPDAFTIVDPGTGSALTMDVVAFGLWVLCDGKTTVSDACRRLSAETELDASTVRAKAAALVLAMMHTRLGYLEG